MMSVANTVLKMFRCRKRNTHTHTHKCIAVCQRLIMLYRKSLTIVCTVHKLLSVPACEMDNFQALQTPSLPADPDTEICMDHRYFSISTTASLQ